METSQAYDGYREEQLGNVKLWVDDKLSARGYTARTLTKRETNRAWKVLKTYCIVHKTLPNGQPVLSPPYLLKVNAEGMIESL